MPSVNYDVLPAWLQWVLIFGAVAAALVAVLGFMRKVWPILKVFVKTVTALDDLPRFMVNTAATLAAQDTQLEEIHHQTHENNGGSLKDALKRVERNQKSALDDLARIPEIEAGVAGLYVRADAVDKFAEELRHDLEATRPKPIRKRIPKPKEITP